MYRRWIGVCVSGVIGVALLLGLASCHLLGTADSHYYVSPDGRDWARGTEAHPWQTLAAAADRAEPGDTIHILPGTYFEPLTPENSGEPDNPITFLGHPGAILDGTGVASTGPADAFEWFGMVNLTSRSQITVTGLEIVNSDYMGIYVSDCGNITLSDNTINETTHQGIGIYGSSDVVVSGNTLQTTVKAGPEAALQIEGVVQFQVTDNTIDGVGVLGDDTGVPGVLIAKDSSSGSVSGNRISDVSGAGIQLISWGGDLENLTVADNEISVARSGIVLSLGTFDEATPTLSDITISGNLIFNVAEEAIGATASGDSFPPVRRVVVSSNRLLGQETGIQLDAAQGPRLLDDVEISNNLIVDSSGIGVQITARYSDVFGSPTVTGFRVVNNTVVNSGFGDDGGGPAEIDGYWGAEEPGTADLDVTIRNNVFTGSGTFSLSVGFSAVVVDHNLFTEHLGAFEETHGSDAVEAVDPGFTDAATGDYSLSASSLARDAGIATLAPSTDILGTSRPQGTAVDLGAFEYVQ